MRAFKGTDANMRCLSFQFELGKEYSIPTDIPLVPCRNGFHCCETLWEVCIFNDINPRFWEVEVEDFIKVENKICARHIKFIRELPHYEVINRLNAPVKKEETFWDLKIPNTNRGFFNIGSHNIGNYNQGRSNNGNYNIGNRNIGNCNEGNDNKGNYNYGNHNYGNRCRGNNELS